MNPTLYKMFLTAQMHDDGLSHITIDFFLDVLPELKTYFRLNAAQMGRLVSVSRETARNHAAELEEKGYLKRMAYRGWRLNEPLLKHPDLIRVVNLLTS
jgi:Mn-dependent DtxR family transcriptional regulator